MSVRYDRIVDSNSFIGRYMELMNSVETARAYDFFCALWLMSLAVGRRCVIARPRSPVYMNMYVILCAESGVTRKSTAIRNATKLARPFLRDHNISLMESRTTPEALEFVLHNTSVELGYAHLAISVSELVSFLGKEKYARSMPGLLTDLYDSPTERRGGGTKSGGQILMLSVYVSFMGASTPSWLVRQVNPDVVEGGFTSRCLFVWSERPKRLIPWPSGLNEVSREIALQEDMKNMREQAETVGSITVSPPALDYFKTWYVKRDRSRDAFRSSFEAREDAHVLRIAGFLSINDNAWLINVNHIRTAISIVDEVKHNGAKLFESYHAPPKVVQGLVKLRDMLIAAGEEACKQSTLTIKLRSYLTGGQITTALEIMHELEMVQRFVPMDKSRRGAPVTFWRATKRLETRSSIEAVVERLGEG